MRIQPPTKTCELCGGQCYGRRHRACYLDQRWAGRGLVGKCHRCGQSFSYAASEGDRQFCSMACYWANGVPHTDAWRERVSRSLKGRRPKNNLAWNGPNHPRWNPDREAVRRRRTDPEYTAWRIAVYERDDYTCQDCGQKGYLHAHHIEFWSQNVERRYDVTNGVTLCVPCHDRRHGRKARAA